VVAIDATSPTSLSSLWSVNIPGNGIVTGQLSIIASDDTGGPLLIVQAPNAIIAYR
jgi:hypothetical protein